ncbi:BTAD domain-containing putative transcriptional regulator [Desulfospira joergensenii]|uniref:BTAD domain-containing putative transcriptional regulator n=1 Tax=Desulfospira joergensenii TaxID=53329 RepID=UPI0003B33595|nr:BTAD domain-containing putative transcriptional regulator [Desulfospira joergensenii]
MDSIEPKLISKLTRPRPTGIIHRQGLDSLVRDIPERKLTLVTAGPGFGKTVFVAQAVSSLGMESLWFRSDDSDTDLEIFLGYLAEGIRSHYPGFFDTGSKSSEIDSLINRFIFELEKNIKNDFLMVLDDYDFIQKQPDMVLFFQTLLDRVIPYIHIILISRTDPGPALGDPDFNPGPGLRYSKLMAGRQGLIITEKDLVFSPREISRFFEDILDLPLDPRSVDLLHGKTGGWISGLILFHQILRNGIDPLETAAGFKGSQRMISNYFDENVFLFLPKAVQDFLPKTAILDQLRVDFCNALLGIGNARQILTYLEDSHFFTFAADPDRACFFFHPLFREFLQAKLEMTVPGDEILELHNRAARLYEKNEQGQEALKSHILAGNIEDASRLLNILARPMIKQGRPQIIKSLLSSIPEHYMDDEPWFQYLQAGYYGLCNQLNLAVQGYEKVLKVFRKNKDEQGECLCRMELAEYYMSTGDLKRSELAYKKILGKNRLDPYLTIIVMGYLIRVLTLSRRTGEADKFARQAISLLPELNDPVSLNMGRGWITVAQGFRHAFSGNYHRAMELAESSISLFNGAGQYRFMFSSYFLISYSCFYLGLFPKGMAAARQGADLDLEKRGFDEFSIFLTLLFARNHLETKDISQDQVLGAIKACKKSLESFQINRFPEGEAQAFLVLHKAYTKAGNLAEAEQSLRRGIKVLDRHDMPLIKNELKVALSQLLFFDRNPGSNREAMALLKDAEQKLLYSGWHISWISRIYARYYWERGHRETAFKYIVYSLKISEEEGFDTWIISEASWILPLMAELLAVNAMEKYIKRLIPKMGRKAREQLELLKQQGPGRIQRAATEMLSLVPQKPVPPIRAHFFGRFKAFLGEEPIPEIRWKSKKARTLFKYLLCMRRKGYLDKEILMELLWPDEDPQKSAQRFHVALAALRKALEPGISKGVKSSYIKRSGPCYRIDPGEEGRIDIEAFSSAFQRAKTEKEPERAAALFKEAEALYQGPFLEEDLYEDWCAREREQYRQAYLSALKNIIAFHDGKKEYQECIRFAEKYLKTDHYSETLVRSLMRYYALDGNRTMVSRVYENFKTRVQRELNCSLSDETLSLYRKLAAV